MCPNWESNRELLVHDENILYLDHISVNIMV